jgi:hypothetical protein
MGNIFDQVLAAVNEASAAQNAVHRNVQAMARLCAGQLRRADVDCSHLKALKMELENYNIHTGKWKKEK